MGGCLQCLVALRPTAPGLSPQPALHALLCWELTWSRRGSCGSGWRVQAVHNIHEARIVHSDLKPANFLMVEGTLKLIDFGIAKAIQSDTTSIARESQVGTLNYMSPEAILGGANNIRGGPPMKVRTHPCPHILLRATTGC